MLSDLFFRAIGFLVQPGFFTEQECAWLRAQAKEAAVDPAGVVHGRDTVVDQSYRSTKRAEIIPDTEAFVVARMQQLRPRLESHFAVSLTELQPLQLLIYGIGDFFALHTDSKDRPEVPDFLRDRKVSIVVYLGHEGVQNEGTHGGVLQFQDLIEDPRLGHRAYAFSPVAGTLLAFPSSALHEVTPVLKGVRYSLVTWYC